MRITIAIFRQPFITWPHVLCALQISCPSGQACQGGAALILAVQVGSLGRRELGKAPARSDSGRHRDCGFPLSQPSSERAGRTPVSLASLPAEGPSPGLAVGTLWSVPLLFREPRLCGVSVGAAGVIIRPESVFVFRSGRQLGEGPGPKSLALYPQTDIYPACVFELPFT